MTLLTLKAAEKCRYDLVALGEVMLRLDPGAGRIHTARHFEAWEGGGEYNVARGLARCFGLRTAVVTALADNPVGSLIADLMRQGGVAQLTKALANEWAARGVNVNAIAPGYVATENTVALRNDPNRNRQILERIPAGRWGEPGDIAGAAVFLCSPASNYLNGHVLAVDGGWLGR